MVQTSFHVLMNYTACVRFSHRGPPFAIGGHKWAGVGVALNGLKLL